VLPVEAHTTARAPRAAARSTATAIPRSLKLPVGLRPSHFRNTSTPSDSVSRGACTSGVDPSPSESQLAVA